MPGELCPEDGSNVDKHASRLHLTAQTTTAGEFQSLRLVLTRDYSLARQINQEVWEGGHRLGWSGRPAGRPGRAATRICSIRDQFHRDRDIGAGCEMKVIWQVEPVRCGFLSLRDPTATNLSVGARARGRATHGSVLTPALGDASRLNGNSHASQTSYLYTFYLICFIRRCCLTFAA